MQQSNCQKQWGNIFDIQCALLIYKLLLADGSSLKSVGLHVMGRIQAYMN